MSDLTLDTLQAALSSPFTLFVLLAFSGLGVPMPEDVTLLYIGVQVAAGHTTWGATMPAAFAGVAVRDLLAWTLGRTLGARLLDAPWFQRVVPAERLDRARTLLADHGGFAVALGRFMVGFRVPVFLAAGASGVPLTTFVAWDGVAMVAAVPLVAAIGYAVGAPVLDVATRILRGGSLTWALIFVAIAFVVLRRRKARAGGDPPVT